MCKLFLYILLLEVNMITIYTLQVLKRMENMNFNGELKTWILCMVSALALIKDGSCSIQHEALHRLKMDITQKDVMLNTLMKTSVLSKKSH